MIRRSKLWLAVASLFTFINVGGAVYAIARGEQLHAAIHVGLLVAAYAVWSLRRARREDTSAAEHADEQLEQLQQSVDSIALEVERIGEAQRFNTKLAAELAEISPMKPRP